MLICLVWLRPKELSLRPKELWLRPKELMDNIGFCIFKRMDYLVIYDIKLLTPCMAAQPLPVNFLDLLGTRIRTAVKFYLDL